MPFQREIFAIINPHAAHGLVRKKWPFIHNHFKKEKFKVIARFTKEKMHAFHIAKDAAGSGVKSIVSIGGDGTFNEIINGVLSCAAGRTNAPELAIIPIGTGADFVRTLNIPLDYRAAIDIIKNGRTKLIDVGRIDFKTGAKKWRRYFANAFDAGIGGSVASLSNRLPKNLGGFLTFLLASLATLVTFKRMKLQVWIDKQFADNGLMSIISAANGQFFGGGMHFAPMALVDDRLLEIIYVKNTNTFKFIVHLLAKVYEAKHLEYRNVYHYKAKELRARCDRVCPMEADGEEERAKEITVSVVPRAIKLRVP